MKKIISLSLLAFIGYTAQSQEKLTYPENEIRSMHEGFEVIMDTVVDGKAIHEIGYINSDSTYLPNYGMWYYLLSNNSCFLTMFRPHDEAAKQDRIRAIELFGNKVSDTQWTDRSPYGKITITLSKDNIGWHFDYIIKNEDRQ